MKNNKMMQFMVFFLLIFGMLSNVFCMCAEGSKSACMGVSSGVLKENKHHVLGDGDMDSGSTSSSSFLECENLECERPRFSPKKVDVKVKSVDEINDDMNKFSVRLKIINKNNRSKDKFNVDVVFEEGTCLQLIEDFGEMNNFKMNNIVEFFIPIKINKVEKDKKERIEFIITRNIKNEETGEHKKEKILTYTKEIFIQHCTKKAIIIVPGIAGSEIFTSSAQVINSKQYRKHHRIWPPEDTSMFIPRRTMEKELTMKPLTLGVSSVKSITELESSNSSCKSKVESGTEFECSSDCSEDEIELSMNKIMGINVRDVVDDFANLICNDDGTSKLETMPAHPFECRKENEKKDEKRFYGAANTYSKIADSLLKVEDLNDYDVIFFSYDWRRSNSESALELERYIDKKNYSQVVLVGHSMGGLVCTSYLSKEENKAKVDKFISLGTPFLGANKAINALETGEFFDGFIGLLIKPVANPLIKKIIRNCPSVYELLPPEQTFKFSTENILETLNVCYRFCCFGKTTTCKQICNFNTYAQLLTKRGWAQNLMQFFSNAQKFHNSLYKGGRSVLDFDDVNFYNIVGYGLNTIGKAQIVYGIDDDIGSLQSVAVSDGDGTVTLASATLANTFLEKNSYYANKIDHLSLISNKDIINLVINIIKNEPEIFNTKVINKIKPTQK